MLRGVLAPGLKRTTVPKMGCGYVVCAVLALGGLGLLLAAKAKWREQMPVETAILAGFGTLLCLGGVGFIGPMRREVVRAKERRRREEARPHEPWTWLPEWIESTGIRQSGRRHAGAMMVFAVAALALSAPALFALKKELSDGNPAILLVLLFPAIAIALLIAAALDAWRRRKYGTARFVPAEIPIPLGGELAGMVLVNRPVIPLRAGRVSLQCTCTNVTRSHNKRTQREDVVAQTEREFVPADWQTQQRESRLFVQIPVRGGAATMLGTPETDSPTYDWRLRIEVPTGGADFVAEFVLPVFEVAERRVSPAFDDDRVDGGPPPLGRSAVAARRERQEVWRAAGIREESQPAAVLGTALVLPAGQGRKLIVAPLIMSIVFAAITLVLWLSPAPGIIAGFFALFAALPALILKSLWTGGGERVWVERDHVCVQRGTAEPRRIAAREIRDIESNRNVGVGSQQFYSIVARTPAPEGRKFSPRVMVATLVRGDEAANEVVTWLQERLTGTTAA